MPKGEYTVNLVERLQELMYDPMVTQDAIVTYSFSQGYERLSVSRSPEHGSSEHSGVYHPNVVCEGVGVCIHCGRTLGGFES